MSNDHKKHSLDAPWIGPWKVLRRGPKTYTIDWKCKAYTVSIDRVQPAYMLSDFNQSCHDVSRSASPTTTPGFLLIKCPMFPPLLLRAMQFVTHLRWRPRRPNYVILAPVLCADLTVTPRKQRLPCLVHTLCFFLFHCCLCVIFAFVWCIAHFRSTLSSAMQSHIILHVFSSNLSPHPCFFLQLPSLAASRNHLVLFCYFSNSPFTSAFQLCFLFNHATLGLRPCPRFCLHSGHNHFFIVPFRSQLLAILVARYCPALIVAIFGNFLWWFSTKRL